MPLQKLHRVGEKMKEINISISDILTLTNNTIATANSSIAHSDMVLTIYLGVITALTVMVTFFVQLYLARDRKKHAEEIRQQFIIDLSNNETVRDELIHKLLSNSQFKEKFNSLIDISVNDKLYDALKEIVDEGKIKEIVGEKVSETLKKGIENGIN